ncbi:hypothetical protein [Microbacterium sp. NPDC087592]|uniref:hypothetical protein n=1 Tax=Microbacterium sp. NPDC087592 TaxID=3364193 RepID=UPI00381B9407
MALWLDLTHVFTFLGIAGTVLALTFGVIAGVAFAITGNPSRGAVATGGWLVSVMFSFTATFAFAGSWVLPAVAIVALPLTLTLSAAFHVAVCARSHAAQSAVASRRPAVLTPVA